MANKNITIEQKNSSGTYDSVYPATSAALVAYTNSILGASISNVEQALVALKNLYGANLPATSYSKIATGYRKTQLTRYDGTNNINVRVRTTAEQVPVYSPYDGDLTNLKALFDTMVAKKHGNLCFTANQAGTVIGMSTTGTPALTLDLQYSLDNSVWNTFTPGTTTVTLASIGDKVYFKGDNPDGISTSVTNYYNFTVTGNAMVSGNIMSIIGDTLVIPNNYCFACLFKGCTGITTAPILPATTLTYGCYWNMFQGCTSLTVAPSLPATTLASNCYFGMFYRCTSLTTLPVLPAVKLLGECYREMFDSCTNIKLSATQTATYQYEYRIPISDSGTAASDAMDDMFVSTGGTFTGTPSINTTYYTDHEPV